MLNAFRKSRGRSRDARRLHAAIVARAREAVFYAELGVPDTIDGRFDLLALHAWLVLDRLREPGINDVSQALIDTIFLGFDQGMRELGAGDMGMTRRMAKMADAFYGRLAAYHAAADVDSMAATLTRNLYRGVACEHAARVARYALAARERLAQQDPTSGRCDFGPLP